MRRAFAAAALVLAAAALQAGSLFVLELAGGAKVFALDRPVERGRVLLFHRYPDGVYTSIPAEKVARIVANAAPPASGKLEPGDLKVLGHDIEGPTAESAGPPPYYPERAAYSAPTYDYALPWGYVSYSGGGGGGRPSGPPRAPLPLVPTNIGPNGFPIIAPRGSPGSTPPPIGSNGFPDISPLREPR